MTPDFVPSGPAGADPVPADNSRCSPIAVASANASLLGIGYLMLGRRRTAVVSTSVSLGLLAVLVFAARSFWFELVFVLWWITIAAHGLWLARRQRGPVGPRTVARQWLLATAVAMPVLLTVAILRIDATRIDHRVTEARTLGDCLRAETAANALGVGHRIAAAPLTARIGDTARVCALLGDAQDAFGPAADGDIGALATGYELLTTVLTRWPGHEAMTGRVLDEFLGRLPGPGDCANAAITDWLRAREPSGPVLGRIAEVVDRIAPTALVGCGDTLMKIGEWARARDRYRQLPELYPRHALADRGRKGITRATEAIELDRLRGLLRPVPGNTQPAYCRTPRPYSGAAPYRSVRPNKALLFGNDGDTARFPASWRAADAADAVLILCLGETGFGGVVETCTYESERDHRLMDVAFHRKSIPVRVFEVRTARVVLDTRVEIGGASCPARIFGFEPNLGDPRYVDTTEADMRAAFVSLIEP